MDKKNIFGLIVIHVSLPLLFGNCIIFSGSGDLVTTTWNVRDFDSIKASHSFEVDVLKSETDEYQVTITMDDNIESYLDLRKYGSTISLGLDRGNFNNMTLRATVYMPELQEARLSGASEINVGSGFTPQDMEVRLSGASTFFCDGLVVDENAEIHLSGASDFKGRNMTVYGLCTVRLSGASEAEITVDGSIDANLSGASELTWYGDGFSDRISTSGASSVRHR